jgi:DNA-binding CsgD family transcriptional regulator
VADITPFFQISDSRFRVVQEWRSENDRELMHAALRADEQSVSEIDLALTWRELVLGLSVVIGTFFSTERCGLVLAPTGVPSEHAVSGRRLDICESVLCGDGQNCIAIDMKLALNARLALQSLGVSGRPSRAHPLLMRSALASKNHQLVAGSRSHLTHDGIDLQVVGIPRPDRCLNGVLPSAELEVVGYLVEGRCYAEIAKRRGTSERTIANQIAAVFRRLKVSGRSELILRLFALERGATLPMAADSAPPPSTVRHPQTQAHAHQASGFHGDSRSSGIRPVASPQARAADSAGCRATGASGEVVAG